LAALGLALVADTACAGHDARESRGFPATEEGRVASNPKEPARPEPPSASIPEQVFPQRVLSLTWDDGPDAHTIELARYLAEEHVSATFFVVAEWRPGLSADPGIGYAVRETGYAKISILEELVRLGHRIGNHTLNHVLLTRATSRLADEELRENQERIDPFIANEVRLFRPPGGAWNGGAERALGNDPYLRDLVGPILWNIDRKDWQSSVDCDSTRPRDECERSPNGVWRVKPGVVADRYFAAIEKARHGIVLLHDRVGDVGSRYALDIARRLVPRVRDRGYVFAAPVLGFPPLASRLTGARAPLDLATVRVADVNGDRRADLCGVGDRGFVCLPSVEREGELTGMPKRAMFSSKRQRGLRLRGVPLLGDVDGDGLADVCARDADGVFCANGKGDLGFGALERWSFGADFSDAQGFGEAEAASSLAVVDVDGDGRADVCGRRGGEVVCAISTGRAFSRSRVWLASGGASASSIAFADVDGDGRADYCERASGAIACAMSSGRGFAALAPWSRDPSLIEGVGSMRLGDLNGDRRADVCLRRSGAIVCALSTGIDFATGTPWLRASKQPEGDAGAEMQLGDINGDGRADVCVANGDDVLCSPAP
jgi:peptidoglycan/xylan/chitin deacetylase (PgdA/CDA1 family)